MGLGMMAVMAATSVASSMSANAQAKSQFESQLTGIQNSLQKQYGQLAEQSKAADDSIALEMATARFEGLKATATTSNTLVERQISGNTAAKIYDQSLVNRTMAHNALAKKAQDSMISYGSAMGAKRDEAINAIYGANAQLSSNTKSTISMTSSAIGAGASGYFSGKSIGGIK